MRTATRDLREAVERLDESLRIVIHLFYFQDLPIKEIASVLDITDGAVRARLHRARGILFDQVKQNRKGSWPMNPFDLDKELREIESASARGSGYNSPSSGRGLRFSDKSSDVNENEPATAFH